MRANDPCRYYSFEMRGDRAVFIRTVRSSVRDVYAALTNPPAGILDVVPAFDGVCVQYDPHVFLFNELRDLLDAKLSNATVSAQQHSSRIVTIPVRYDGPDLHVIAQHARLSMDDVVAIHVSGTYEVQMIGFAPGFGYLTGLDQRLATPRRETPRTHVVAGSVGIGGEFTGVYPVDSPGGWHLIGHTELRMFDAARSEPTMLQPGDIVRFVAT